MYLLCFLHNLSHTYSTCTAVKPIDFVHFILKFSEEMSMKQTKLIWMFPRQDLEYDWHLNLIDW